MSMVHFAIVDDGPGVSPLCGGWGVSRDWTLLRGAVSCPRCLLRLRRHEQGPRARALVEGLLGAAPWSAGVPVVRSLLDGR